MLARCVNGFGLVALAGLLTDADLLTAAEADPKAGPFPNPKSQIPNPKLY